MALLGYRSGCKVGWSFYDNEDEARADAVEVVKQRERMLKDGYDFGYQWPGSVAKTNDREYGECWVLVTP